MVLKVATPLTPIIYFKYFPFPKESLSLFWLKFRYFSTFLTETGCGTFSCMPVGSRPF